MTVLRHLSKRYLLIAMTDTNKNGNFLNTKLDSLPQNDVN